MKYFTIMLTNSSRHFEIRLPQVCVLFSSQTTSEPRQTNVPNATHKSLIAIQTESEMGKLNWYYHSSQPLLSANWHQYQSSKEKWLDIL